MSRLGVAPPATVLTGGSWTRSPYTDAPKPWTPCTLPRSGVGKTGRQLLTREERLAMDPPREGSEGAVEVPQAAAGLSPSAAVPDLPPSAAVPDVPPSAAAVPATRPPTVIRILLAVTIVATL